MQLAINIFEIIGLLLIGIVSLDTYGTKRRIKPQKAFGLLAIAGSAFMGAGILLILSSI
ncbi:hypothetical protein K4A81_10915 [Bacillus velezensis]|uniref:hypothetical protein n=1 Tax=Bacillus velezensis TaxID=492670 RepID=UPI001CA3C986|nr:hypothetical protein [Bacillus velezensis]QZY39755.1 hypothetical protein K4A81_10915 [Bacillus velezensis]